MSIERILTCTWTYTNLMSSCEDATICEEELLQNIQVYTIGTIGIVGTVVEYCDDLCRDATIC